MTKSFRKRIKNAPKNDFAVNDFVIILPQCGTDKKLSQRPRRRMQDT